MPRGVDALGQFAKLTQPPKIAIMKSSIGYSWLYRPTALLSLGFFVLEDTMKSSLLTSRKFWIMVVNVVISVATYFVTKYFNPDAAKDVLFLIGSMQPVILAVVASITVQNVQYIKADERLKSERFWAAEDVKAAEKKAVATLLQELPE